MSRRCATGPHTCRATATTTWRAAAPRRRLVVGSRRSQPRWLQVPLGCSGLFSEHSPQQDRKAASSLYLAEQRPWLVPAGWTLVAIVVAGGLGFAVIENWIYLNVYIDDPSDAIIRWRWIAGPLVHGSASMLAGIGVRRIWTQTNTTGAKPDAHRATPWFIAAVTLHGTYNALAVLAEVFELI